MHIVFTYFSVSEKSFTFSDTDSSDGSKGKINDKSKEVVTCDSLSDMDISNGPKSVGDDNDKENVSFEPRSKQLPKQNERAHRAKDDTESKIPRTIPTSFYQYAVDVTVMQLTLQYLEKCNLSVEQLSDDQLKTYIEYVIDSNYYQKNLRSESVESQVSVDSSHSR